MWAVDTKVPWIFSMTFSSLWWPQNIPEVKKKRWRRITTSKTPKIILWQFRSEVHWLKWHIVSLGGKLRENWDFGHCSEPLASTAYICIFPEKVVILWNHPAAKGDSMALPLCHWVTKCVSSLFLYCSQSSVHQEFRSFPYQLSELCSFYSFPHPLSIPISNAYIMLC